MTEDNQDINARLNRLEELCDKIYQEIQVLRAVPMPMYQTVMNPMGIPIPVPTQQYTTDTVGPIDKIKRSTREEMRRMDVEANGFANELLVPEEKFLESSSFYFVMRNFLINNKIKKCLFLLLSSATRAHCRLAYIGV